MLSEAVESLNSSAHPLSPQIKYVGLANFHLYKSTTYYAIPVFSARPCERLPDMEPSAFQAKREEKTARLTSGEKSCKIVARGKQTVAWAGRKAVHEESPGSTGQG